MRYTPNENLDKVRQYLLSGAIRLDEKVAEQALYQEFIAAFPPSGLNQLTLAQYCMGTGDNDSFCWWIERGLVPLLGRYSPGNAKGHLIYYQNEQNRYYKHSQLQGLSDEDALKPVLSVLHVLANARLPEDRDWLDNRREIMRRAGIQQELVGGDARKIRILACYHPDQLLPVNSPDYIQHFLSVLGFPLDQVPPPSQPIARLLTLDLAYQELQREIPQLTRRAFMNALYAPNLGLAPSKDETPSDITPKPHDDDEEPEMFSRPSLNTILYGPPGTGKTYATLNEALAILEPDFVRSEPDRPSLKARFDTHVQNGDIRFVTFHQSFSYEDFVEGLRPETGEDGQLRYEVADGVFKQICDAAAVRVTQSAETQIDLKGRAFWKMSLGNTQGDDSYIYDTCIDSDQIMLGYGGHNDFSNCQNREQVLAKLQETQPHIAQNDYTLTSVTTLATRMKPGDLVVVTEGNFKFRAIGEICGDYRYLPREDGYCQTRPVKWLRVYSVALPYDQLMHKKFSQMTLYELNAKSLDLQKLAGLLSPQAETLRQEPTPKVLIIDEINRGNVSRIFGELITLIEPSKRAGAPEALQVVLPYSKQPFSVPGNLYLIGTMNTADRSLAGLDMALRRRFRFKEMPPQYSALDGLSIAGVDIGALLRIMNARIEVLLGRDHCLGHAYFMDLKAGAGLEELALIFEQQILPLLQEYFFEDWDRIRWVLNDHRKPSPQYCFVSRRDIDGSGLFGPDVPIGPQQALYVLNAEALIHPQSYLGIIDAQLASP